MQRLEVSGAVRLILSR